MMPTLVKISNKEGKKNLGELLCIDSGTVNLPTNHLWGGPLQSEDFDHPPQPRFPAPAPQQQLFPQLGSAPAPPPPHAAAGTGLLPHSLAGLARIFIICRCCRGLACKQTHFSIFICNHPVIG